jgi:hypothetical protein
MRFHPLLIYLLMQRIVLFLEQKESFIVFTNRFRFLYYESTLKRLLGGFLFITQHKLDLFRHKTIYCEGLFIQCISVDMYWLPYRSVSRPICVLKKIRVSLYVRASKSSVFSSTGFIFSKKNKNKLQFLFPKFEVVSIVLKIRMICW